MKVSLMFMFLSLALWPTNAMPQGDSGIPTDPVALIFNSSTIVVNPGEPLHLDCGVTGDHRMCIWEINGKTIQVADVGILSGVSKPSVTSGNECGIIIDSVAESDHGNWTCKAYVVGQSLVGHKKVIVTKNPSPPRLQVAARPLVVNEEEDQTVTCQVEEARPQVDIRWMLEDEDLTYSSHVENQLAFAPGIYKTTSTLTYSFRPWDNHMNLRCEVSHHTLSTPLEDAVEVVVRYKPFGRDVKQYEQKIGEIAEAHLNFISNPAPTHLKWGFAEQIENAMSVLPVPGEEAFYSTEFSHIKGDEYRVILRIADYKIEDSQQIFKIRVWNDLGDRNFSMVISYDKAPSDELADGENILATSNLNDPEEPLSNSAIVGIVFIVLLAVLLIACAVYMKHARIYCFAPKKEASAADDKEAAVAANSEAETAVSEVEGEAEEEEKKKPSVGIWEKITAALKNKGKKEEVKEEENGIENTKGDETPTKTAPPS